MSKEERRSENMENTLPTPEEIKAVPDRILELYDCCPECGSKALEALTWKSIGSDDVTVGCWEPECGWWITPPGYVPADQHGDERIIPGENVEVIHGMKGAKNERNELASPTGSDQVRVGDHYCIDGVKYLVTLVLLGEAFLTSRCAKLRIEKCSWILSQNDKDSHV